MNSQLFLFARLKNALLPAETVRVLSKLWTVSLKRNNKNIPFPFRVRTTLSSPESRCPCQAEGIGVE